MRDNEFCPSPVKPRIVVPGLESSSPNGAPAIDIIETLYLCWKHGSSKAAVEYSKHYDTYIALRIALMRFEERAGQHIHVHMKRQFTLNEYGKYLIEEYLGKEIPEMTNPNLL